MGLALEGPATAVAGGQGPYRDVPEPEEPQEGWEQAALTMMWRLSPMCIFFHVKVIRY